MMETKFKKLSLALLTLGVAGVAAAGGYVPPAKETGYHVGIDIHYLHQHNDSDIMRYARTVGTTEHTIHVADFDWSWGFNLEGAYHDGDGNDYKLEWTYLDGDKETSTAKDPNIVGDIPHLQTFYRTVNFHKVSAITEADFNQVNFEIGHTYDSHGGFTARVHGGLAWVDVDKDLSFYAWDSNGDLAYVAHYNGDFSGVGLRTGVDMDWTFYNDLHIFARAAVALLYGDLDADSKVDSDADKNYEAKTHTDSDEDTIVPELQARIGLAWHHNDWVVNLGWRHDVLIHSDKFAFTETNGSANVLRDGFTGNYSHGGPFLGVVWHS